MPRPFIAAFFLGGLLVLLQPVNVHVIRPDKGDTRTVVHGSISALALPAARQVEWQSATNESARPRLTPAQATDTGGLVLGKGTQGLPAPVAAMRAAILDAVRSGVIEEMREPIEMSEIKPEFGPEVDTDPIAYWKGLSPDGEGREVLAVLASILEMGWARRPVSDPSKGRAMYVWPYLAELPPQAWSAEQQADLERMMPQAAAEATRRSGRYRYWSLGIAEDGTWHFFVRGE